MSSSRPIQAEPPHPPLLKISAHDIDTAGIGVDAALPVDWLDRELEDADIHATGPGRVTGRLSRSANEIVVRGRVVASVATPCARCLQPAAVAVDTELALLLKPAPAAVPNKPAPVRPDAGRSSSAGTGGRAAAKKRDVEVEFAAEDADIDVYDGEHVILDPFVREAILLEMPNFPLCSEACPGIRPPPGPEAEAAKGAPSVDPRLAPLGALLDKLGQKTGSQGEPRPKAGGGKKKSPPPLMANQRKPKKKNKE